MGEEKRKQYLVKYQYFLHGLCPCAKAPEFQIQLGLWSGGLTMCSSPAFSGSSFGASCSLCPRQCPFFLGPVCGPCPPLCFVSAQDLASCLGKQDFSSLIRLLLLLAPPPTQQICLQLFPLQGLPGGSDGKESACNAGDPGLIPGSGISPGEGNGNPLQYSSLENHMDRGA